MDHGPGPAPAAGAAVAEPLSVEDTVVSGSPAPSAGAPRRKAVLGVVVLALVLQLVPRIWGAAGGWFYADDFWRQDWVTRASPWEIASLGQGGHFAPLSFLLTYGFTALTPFNWPAQVVAAVVLWLVADLLVLAVFRALWGWGWPTAVAFALYALSPLTAPSFLWSNQVWLGWAAVASLALILLTSVRAVRRPGLRRDAIAWASLAVALLMAERTALEAVAVALLLPVAFASDAGGVRAFLRRSRRLYAGGALVLAGYAALYLTVVPQVQSDPLLTVRPTTQNLLPAMAEGLQQSVGPGLLGGPWWLDDSAVLTHAAVPGLAVFLALQALLLVIVAAFALRRSGWPALVLLVGVVTVTLGMIAVSRSGPGGLLIMHDYRYYANLAVWFPLLLVLAVVPPGDPARESWPAELPGTVRTSLLRHPVVWGLVALVLVDGMLITTGQSAARFRTSTARDYLSRTLSDLDRLGPVTLADRQLPADVVPALLTVQTMASRVLSAAQPRPTFDVPTERLYSLDDRGAILPADLVGGPVSLPGPDGDCGTAVQPGESERLVLGSGLFDWNWWARIDYLAQADTTLRVRAGRSTAEVPVHRGAGRVFVPVSGAVRDLVVSAPAGGGGVCIAGIRVGGVGPAAGAAP